MLTIHYSQKYLMKNMVLYAFIVSILFSVATSVLCGAEEHTLPVTTCKRNSADYSTCLKVALQESWPRFCKGLPEFDFPELEPFLYKYYKLIVNRNGIYVEGILTNITVTGPADIRFLDVRPHFQNDVFRLEVDTQLPKVFIQAHGTGAASVSGIRLSGTGQINATMHGVKQTWDITGYIKNDTWTVEHVQLFMTVENLKVILYSFGDNKELADLFQNFINEYWPFLYRIGWPILMELVDPMLTDLSNRLFSKVPFSEVFP